MDLGTMVRISWDGRMHFTRYDDVHRFYADTFDVLRRAEAQNQIILGNVIMGHAGDDTAGWRDPAGWFMGIVTDESAIRLIALMTPPYNVTLYETGEPSPDVLRALIDRMAASGVRPPGVTTEAGLATRFAHAWTQAHGVGTTIKTRQRIYELTNVNPEVPVVGRLRPAGEADMSYLPYWFEAFHLEAGLRDTGQPGDDPAPYRHAIQHDGPHVLEVDGTPVSTAWLRREVVSAAGISFVYTPPYFRNHGYASSCVAQLSQLCLDRGFTRCVLYTDLANPVSNSIYQRIGYRPVCDSMEIVFDEG